MTDRDEAIEAAEREFMRRIDHVDGDPDRGLRAAIAAWCEAEADHVTHIRIYSMAIVEAWLRGKAAELRGRK